MQNSKNYSDFHILEYPENSGKEYIWNPYNFGRGSWAILTAARKPGKYVDKLLQQKLNAYFFGRRELPSLYERFLGASAAERIKLRDISIGWLQLKLQSLQQGVTVPGEVGASSARFSEGGMYFYLYDAKWKDILPIWDKLPLTIVLEKYSDGFLGLNMHYLDERARLILLNKFLQGSMYYNKGTDTLKLLLHYNDLKSSSKYSGYEVCIKRYLTNHIKSKILPIESHEWAYSIILPVARFQKNQKGKR